MSLRSRRTLGPVTICTCLALAALVAGAASAAAPDFTGYWRFDAAHSDQPQRPEGGGGRQGREARGGRGGGTMGGGGMGGGSMEGGRRGGWRGRGGSGGGKNADGGSGGPGAGARPAMLPALIHITQTSAIVSLEDSAGVVLEEITTLGTATDTLAHAPNAAVSHGAWQDTALVVDRGGSNGFKLTRTLTVEEGGQVLVIRTHFEAPDGARARDFRRVYRRVTEG